MESKIDLINDVNVIIFRISGRLLKEDDIQFLEEKIQTQLVLPFNKVLFDLSALNYTNSSGINLFMKIMNKSRILGGDIAFFGVQGDVKKLFDVAKLSEIYTVFASEEEGKEYFKNN
jgi:anti-anti-sigma factor